MRKSRTIVYAGSGSSHSWTWLADLFESNGVLSVRFLDSKAFISSVENGGAGVAIISGGDGFAIAEAFKGQGFKKLREFALNGGTLAGICAGAYLPLPSSVEPFSEFNISTTKIENIVCETRPGSGLKPRESVTYGNCSIIHPIRGPVEISSDSGESVIAPLYGGPIFKEPVRDTVTMRYRSFTPGTEFQAERENARTMIINRPAVIRVAHGNGSLVLFGPHLEHPKYPQANVLFLRLLAYDHSDRPDMDAEHRSAGSRHPELRRSISDLKVAILGLENRSFTVGHKAWDGSRFLEVVSAIEKRQWTLTDSGSELVGSSLDRVRERLLAMTIGSDSEADAATSLLIDTARVTVDHHFAVLAER